MNEQKHSMTGAWALDALDAEDDVQNVYSNEDISDEDAAKYAG